MFNAELRVCLQGGTETSGPLEPRIFALTRRTVGWPLNFSVKCLYFHFEFAEGQNTKIQSKYKNPFQAQNVKISAVSTPSSTAKAAFFSVFQVLSEKSVEHGSKPQKIYETFAPKFGKFEKSQNVDIFWHFSCILTVWYFASILHFHFEI